MSLFLAVLASAIAWEPNPALDIWFNEPARNFMESSPIGNGRLGAMIFGGIESDHIPLNESTMWSGGPQDADRTDALAVLPRIREHLQKGENKEAQELLQSHFVCAGQGSGGPRYGTY